MTTSYHQVKQHYQSLLSQHYTWTFGEKRYSQNQKLLNRFITKKSRIIDLGCGSGFQSIPLIDGGHQVYCIDSCTALLGELKDERSEANIIEGDLLLFDQFVQDPVNVIICMGDTLTHLSSLQEIKDLFTRVYHQLNDNGGIFIVQYRDLSKPLVDSDRFIPVRSDERTVFTCFLEWEDGGKVEEDGSGCKIKVHDLVHVKKGIGAWELMTSWYRKLGLTPDSCTRIGTDIGFQLQESTFDESGMVLIVFTKE
jgi:SAM-dependent methyltransferase